MGALGGTSNLYRCPFLLVNHISNFSLFPFPLSNHPSFGRNSNSFIFSSEFLSLGQMTRVLPQARKIQNTLRGSFKGLTVFHDLRSIPLKNTEFPNQIYPLQVEITPFFGQKLS